MLDVVAEEAIDPVAHDLGECADAPGEDRRPAGQRLDGRQPERLGPRPGHEHRVAGTHDPVAILAAQLTQVLDE